MDWWSPAVAVFQHAGHVMQQQPTYTPDPVSLFNHRFAGFLVICTALFSYLEQTNLAQRFRWIRFLWPIPLLILGTDVLLWSDSPARTLDFHRWAPHATAIQHKVFASMTIAIGMIELFRRTEYLKHPAWRQVLNVIMLTAGVMILMHGGPKHTDQIHTQHVWIASAAVALSICKIVADYRGKPRWLGLYVVPALFLAVGLQLALYVE